MSVRPQGIYLDYNSTTPVDPLVLDAMLPYFQECFGNPSNTSHAYGTSAAQAVALSRASVSSVIGCRPDEIVFTSGATESNNLAVLGVARRGRANRDHVIASAIEHKAVLNPCAELRKEGFQVTLLPVDQYGMVDPADVERATTERTLLVSVMAANNEIGTIQQLEAIGRVCRSRGVLFHTDAAQSVSRVPTDVEQMSVDLLSMSAHKMYGPKGVGALYVNAECRRLLGPLVFGGDQEDGLRSGTLPVPLIVGFGKACELALARLEDDSSRVRELRERLRSRLASELPTAVFHGHPSQSLPGLLSVGVAGVDGDVVIGALQGLAISQGSSCSQGAFEPSHVLRAIGLSYEMARSSFRFGIGRSTTEAEIDVAVGRFVRAVHAAVG